MQEPVGPDIRGDLLALWLGIAVAVFTVLKNLKWIGRQLATFVTWLMQRGILALIRSDSKVAHDSLIGLLPELLETRRLLGQLEDRVVKLEDAMRVLEREMRSERHEMRQDLTVMGVRHDTAMRETRQAIDEMRDAVQQVARSVHTLIALDAGPEEVRKALRQQMFGDSP
jgi:hypothetical protein